MSKKSGKCGAESDGVRQLLKYAPGVLGGVITPAAGLALEAAGVPGGEAIVPMLSSVVGNVISGIGQDFWSRRLSQHEKRRVGTVLGYAIDEIDRRFQAGESVRADDFFDVKLADRSDAEEVAESVILKVQREPEEKKIPYMGYLFSSVAFDAEVSTQLAHQIAKVAEQLTYRQLCILKLAAAKDEYELRDRDYRDHDDFRIELTQILYECAELYDRQYINFRGEPNLHTREYSDFGATIAGLTNAIPSRMTLQGMGEHLYDVMMLSRIPEGDIAPIAEQLK